MIAIHQNHYHLYFKGLDRCLLVLRDLTWKESHTLLLEWSVGLLSDFFHRVSSHLPTDLMIIFSLDPADICF